MRFYPVGVKEESYGLYDYIMEGIEAASNFDFPQHMTSPYSKAKYFKKEKPEYHKIPNSILRGYFKFDKPKSDGMMGLRFKHSDILHVWGLGYIRLSRPLPRLNQVKQITFRGNHELILHGLGQIGSNTPIKLANYSDKPLNVLEKEDPIFRYLKVNQVFTEYGWKKMCLLRDVIAHLHYVDPNMTRKEIERLGIRGDKMWDLIVNYEPSLDVILRAGSKPEMKYKILSKGQHKKRMDREWSMADHLSASDIDAGNLKKQSFDFHTYEAVRSDKWAFYN